MEDRIVQVMISVAEKYSERVVVCVCLLVVVLIEWRVESVEEEGGR